MMGAAVLEQACLRSGLGLVEVHVPKTGLKFYNQLFLRLCVLVIFMRNT